MILNLHNPNVSSSMIKDIWDNFLNRASNQRGIGAGFALFALLMTLPVVFVLILIWRWVIPFIPGLYQARTRPRVWNIVYGLLLMSFAIRYCVGPQTIGIPTPVDSDPHSLAMLSEFFDKAHLLTSAQLKLFTEHRFFGGILIAAEYYTVPLIGLYLVVMSLLNRGISPSKQMLLTYGTGAFIFSEFNLGAIVVFFMGEAGGAMASCLIDTQAMFTMMLMMLMYAWQPFVALPNSDDSYKDEIKKMDKVGGILWGIIGVVGLQKLIMFIFIYLPILYQDHHYLEANIADFFVEHFIGSVLIMTYIVAGGIAPWLFFDLMVSRTPRWVKQEKDFDKSSKFPYAYVR